MCHPTMSTLGQYGGGSQDIDDFSKFCSSGIHDLWHEHDEVEKLEDMMMAVGQDLVDYARAVGLTALEQVGSRDAASMAYRK